MLLKIASRNIWRSKKRSAIIIAAVGIGLWTGVFLMAFYNGMIEQRINTAITSELSHIQLHHPEFRKENDIRYYLPNGRKILQKITEDTLVQAATGRIIIKGMMASASGSCGITINGINPYEENLTTNLRKKISSGSYFSSSKKNEIIISERLSKKLKLKKNKKTILTFQDKEGNLASSAFRIIAIYKTINAPYDDTTIFVKNEAIDSLAGIPNELNEIAVLLKSNQKEVESKKKLKMYYPNLEINNWKEIAPEIGLTLTVGNQMVYLFMGIILLALAFGIVNTMMMSVLERTRELGMLLALGMNKFKIMMMILLETFFLIGIGCPIGILLALLTIEFTKKTGIDLTRYIAVYSSFGYSHIIYPNLKLSQLEMILKLVIGITLFSSIFPVRRVLKINPATSLKK